MASFSFELVSPERVLFAGDVNSVVVPAAEGTITVLAGHAPFMSALRAGIVTVDAGKRLFVRGGFVDVSAKGLTLLAEAAIALEDANPDAVRADIAAAETALKDAKSDFERASAADTLEGLKVLSAAISH